MKNQRSAKPTVLIFKETLLPLSETFIEAQTGHLVQFSPRYAGLGRVSPSLPLPDDSILLTKSISRISELRQKVYRRIGIAPSFHRCAGKTGAQLIHAHFASGGRSALHLTRRLRIPLIVTLHGADVTVRMNFRERYAELWKQASMFICVSDFIRHKALAAGFPEKKLLKLFIGMDREVFRPMELRRDSNLVLFVGRLVEKKGCTHLLQAMNQVRNQHPDAKTIVIGDGPQRSSMEQQAKQLNLRCEFLGSQPSSIVRNWMSRARVFCVPSITAENGDSEGLGMVFGEAQAMGTPVVSYCHGGIPEIVLHERTGLLAPEGDHQTLTQYIGRMFDDEPFWKQCVDAGIAWVKSRFDLDTQTRELERMYSEIILSRVKQSSELWRNDGVSAVEGRV